MANRRFTNESHKSNTLNDDISSPNQVAFSAERQRNTNNRSCHSVNTESIVRELFVDFGPAILVSLLGDTCQETRDEALELISVSCTPSSSKEFLQTEGAIQNLVFITVNASSASSRRTALRCLCSMAHAPVCGIYFQKTPDWLELLEYVTLWKDMESGVLLCFMASFLLNGPANCLLTSEHTQVLTSFLTTVDQSEVALELDCLITHPSQSPNASLLHPSAIQILTTSTLSGHSLPGWLLLTLLSHAYRFERHTCAIVQSGVVASLQMLLLSMAVPEVLRTRCRQLLGQGMQINALIRDRILDAWLHTAQDLSYLPSPLLAATFDGEAVVLDDKIQSVNKSRGFRTNRIRIRDVQWRSIGGAIMWRLSSALLWARCPALRPVLAAHSSGGGGYPEEHLGLGGSRFTSSCVLEYSDENEDDGKSVILQLESQTSPEVLGCVCRYIHTGILVPPVEMEDLLELARCASELGMTALAEAVVRIVESTISPEQQVWVQDFGRINGIIELERIFPLVPSMSSSVSRPIRNSLHDVKSLEEAVMASLREVSVVIDNCLPESFSRASDSHAKQSRRSSIATKLFNSPGDNSCSTVHVRSPSVAAVSSDDLSNGEITIEETSTDFEEPSLEEHGPNTEIDALLRTLQFEEACADVGGDASSTGHVNVVGTSGYDISTTKTKVASSASTNAASSTSILSMKPGERYSKMPKSASTSGTSSDHSSDLKVSERAQLQDKRPGNNRRSFDQLTTNVTTATNTHRRSSSDRNKAMFGGGGARPQQQQLAGFSNRQNKQHANSSAASIQKMTESHTSSMQSFRESQSDKRQTVWARRGSPSRAAIREACNGGTLRANSPHPQQASSPKQSPKLKSAWSEQDNSSLPRQREVSSSFKGDTKDQSLADAIKSHSASARRSSMSRSLSASHRRPALYAASSTVSPVSSLVTSCSKCSPPSIAPECTASLASPRQLGGHYDTETSNDLFIQTASVESSYSISDNSKRHGREIVIDINEDIDPEASEDALSSLSPNITSASSNACVVAVDKKSSLSLLKAKRLGNVSTCRRSANSLGLDESNAKEAADSAGPETETMLPVQTENVAAMSTDRNALTSSLSVLKRRRKGKEARMSSQLEKTSNSIAQYSAGSFGTNVEGSSLSHEASSPGLVP